MPQPVAGDLIDIHTHDPVRKQGVFSVSNLMLHEGGLPDDSADAFSAGIHPWFLNKETLQSQLDTLAQLLGDERVIAVGEAGYDHRRGAPVELQQLAFETQATMAGECGKPLIIHCVKGWDELWASRRRLKPTVPWIVHGFNGSTQQARQLVEGGLWLALWVKSVLNGALADVIAQTPPERLFLETDGFDTELSQVYAAAARACSMSSDNLAEAIRNNYLALFV